MLSRRHLTKMGLVRENINKLDDVLKSEPRLDAFFNKLESKTGIQRKYLAGGVILAVFLALFLKIAENLVCNIFGFLYPAYQSIKAIESKETDDDTRFLTYWVVYSSFSILEIFADVLLFWVPFYYLLKCAFLLWCMHPNSRGTDFIYQKLIRPVFRKNTDKVEEFLKKAGEEVEKYTEQVKDVAKDAVLNKND